MRSAHTAVTSHFPLRKTRPLGPSAGLRQPGHLLSRSSRNNSLLRPFARSGGDGHGPTKATRRSLMSVAAIGSLFGRGPDSLVRSGMDKFRKGEIDGSLEDFDRVYKDAPQMRAYLWQRGLSLYYAGRFQEGADQFREDVSVNPNDSEEAIWAFMCEVLTDGIPEAQKNFLQVGRDPRPVLRAALDCFENGKDPKQIASAAPQDGSGEHFYSLLYVALWNEAYGNPETAEENMVKATATRYAQFSGDYMASLAKVHCMERDWNV
ncbi:hypothetical protein BSKO_10439 [Bryopsis sp. KO-2023]|nr:hypothetical protein BSKO_10439 [Bryopsis sp. KO-2023]